MLKKRIIFALLYSDGYFHLSRNFRLQKVGNLDWLIHNFGFGETCHFIDELMCILVKENPSKEDKISFLKDIEKLRKKIFVPITIGGGISDREDVKNYFLNGADKILVNSNIYNDDLMKMIEEEWGKQSLSIMIDCAKNEHEMDYKIMINCGKKFKLNLKEFIKIYFSKLPYGEIIINSIDNDGNGSGLDLEILKIFPDTIKSPILLMGGAGKPEHIFLGLNEKKISGVVTANLFNFLGSGLEIARKQCLNKGINLANFQKLAKL
tara:strand:+ start:2711 stop:3505 length:795 start_codon:yes stop_codon:yes gene_type:complete